MIRGILSLLLLVSFYATQAASPLDSVGVEKKNGKTYVVHKVEAKETLYSLARKYSVSVEEIKSANDGLAELKVGQTVLIPSRYSGTSNSFSNTKSGKTHTVQAKETMYSISRKYDVSMDDLKKANPGLSELKVGQTISIPQGANAGTSKEESKADLPDTYTIQPKETFYSVSKKFGVTVNEIKRLNPDITELKVGQILKLKEGVPIHADATNIESKEEVQETRIVVERKETPKKIEGQEKKNIVQVKEPQTVTTPEKNVPTYSNLKKDGYMKINESGLVETYPDNSGFHYALHKTAPIGTIIYLVNEENGQKVYVRVMGKLSETTPGVIMKLSPKAYEKLAQGGTKVKVTATYIP